MTFDNDLMDLWLRAGDLDSATVRKLIEAVQAGREPAEPPSLNHVYAKLGDVDDTLSHVEQGILDGTDALDDKVREARDELALVSELLDEIEGELGGTAGGDNARLIEDARRMAFVPRVAQSLPALAEMLL